MKNFKFFFLGLLCVNLFLFSSCGSDDEDNEPSTEIVDIVATAQGVADLSMLVEAVIKTDLTATLQSDGPFTVFAPNNAAFQALLDTNADWSSIEDIPTAALTDILLFHVLGANVNSTDLTDSYVTTASLGPDDKQVALQIDVTGGVVFNGSANPVTVDVEATNGTVHIINEVMLRPTVVNHALNNPAFSSLVAALTRTGNTTDFVAVLSGDGPFTVFAPTNDAFDALIAGSADWNSLDDIPEATLDAVLKYHVFGGGNVQAGQLTDGQVVPMLNGSDITIDLSDGAKITTASGQSVDIIITDVQGTNGVVHAVNSVLLP
ncbi:MAG: putative surface protein with fasciclin (FAS1) repeats [Polaribacter sp.]|jgi:uncharacterized surface protein with fasciclin (FAS1) repeats